MNDFERACSEIEENIQDTSSDMCNENVIEWIRNSETATVTFSQRRYITKIEKLAKRFPNKVKIIHKNEDGTILAHIPVKAVKISIIERELTEEQKDEMRERIKNINKG